MKDNIVVMSVDDFAELQVKEPPKRRHELYNEIVEYSIDGEYLRTFESSGLAGIFHHISAEHIRNICNGVSLYSKKTNTIFLDRGADINERLKLIDKKLLQLSKHATKYKVIHEYTLGGRFLCKWPGATLPAKAYNITPHAIHNCCKGKSFFLDKHIFLYADGDIKQRVKDVKAELYRLSKKRPKYREVDEYTLDGKFIKGYPSASAASRELGIHVSDITRCCNGGDNYEKNRFTCKGRIFLWIGGSISDRLELIKDNKNVQ